LGFRLRRSQGKGKTSTNQTRQRNDQKEDHIVQLELKTPAKGDIRKIDVKNKRKPSPKTWRENSPR